MEFFPVGVPSDQSGVLLHETGYLPRNDWWVFPNTLSPFWRLYYNNQPGHQVVFPDAEFNLDPAHIVLIPDRQLFHSVGRKPVSHLWLTFQVARRLDGSQSVPVLLRPTPTERYSIEEIKRHFHGIGQGNREHILHTSLALLHLLLIRPEIRWQNFHISEPFSRALRHIEREHATSLKIPDLARIAGLSVRGFTKTFGRVHGMSPGKHITRVRVREAASLLANSTDSLDSIAEKTGFPNRHYMSRIFKKITGFSPANFRHQTTHNSTRSSGV